MVGLSCISAPTLVWLVDIGLIPGATVLKFGTRRSRYAAPQVLARQIGAASGEYVRNQRRQRENVRIIDAAIVHVPVIRAERAASQRIRDHAKIAAPTCVKLHFAIAQQIVGAT